MLLFHGKPGKREVFLNSFFYFHLWKNHYAIMQLITQKMISSQVRIFSSLEFYVKVYLVFLTKGWQENDYKSIKLICRQFY